MAKTESIFDDVDALRRSILVALLIFTTAFGAAFAVLNYFHANYEAMVGEIAMGSFALVLVPVIRRTPHLVRWSFVYLVLFDLTMMLILATPQSAPSVFAWVLLIPILSHMLLGRALGGGVSVVFLVIAFLIYYGRFSDSALNGNPRALLNVAGVALCIFGFSFVYETSRSRAENALKRQALSDPLTGLGNRAFLGLRFAEEKARWERHGTPCAMLLLDIDFFKKINDSHGHEAGDTALKAMSALLVENLRPNDDVVRYGGEEFCLLLSHATPHDARQAAEKLRRLIATSSFEDAGRALSFTASIGVATLPEDGTDLQALLGAADKRLYAAKVAGRNRVVWE
ncbi:GGDEF domain-containing protein [Jiella sonneratiae]|uniref:diguanylate cyclase n=1 Tax=Jiella sonneratiae TaxID=2816856 RepID=A0ABS3J4S0_9HYPH|nr:GGDEF domain-containing protein [Jiella sonneratiae]MBO0904652.1 GGDEF domain-containing protein [Jiella sonneratiae]